MFSRSCSECFGQSPHFSLGQYEVEVRFRSLPGCHNTTRGHKPSQAVTQDMNAIPDRTDRGSDERIVGSWNGLMERLATGRHGS
jgi:hypothetical protein